MFGNEYDIAREFNTYFLDYQEHYNADTRWTDRIMLLQNAQIFPICLALKTQAQDGYSAR